MSQQNNQQRINEDTNPNNMSIITEQGDLLKDRRLQRPVAAKDHNIRIDPDIQQSGQI